jgi:DNA-binding CsgD family transcriptional regulator
MAETEQLSSLIGDIYDAALDPSRWTSALEKTCAYVQGACSGLIVQDPIIDSGQFHFSWGVDPDYERLYVEKYVRLNQAVMLLVSFGKTGEVHSTETLMPYEEYLASQFHNEWAKPQEYCDFVGAILDKAPTSIANISVIRHERHGRADDDARQRMTLLVPHFRRAVAIGKIVDLHKVEAAAMADTLDGLAAAMFLVDVGGRIVHANAAGSALLEKGSLIRNAGGKFATSDGNADRALYDIFAIVENGDRALGSKGVAVPLSSRDDERYVAHVLPLTSGARRKAGVAYSAVAAVFVRKAALDLPHPLEAIANAFKLTPAEMRVLMMIVQHGGVPEVASVLGISETTVKTHLQRIFAKTKTSRQADLVKLVAGYMSPLGS